MLVFVNLEKLPTSYTMSEFIIVASLSEMVSVWIVALVSN